MSQPGRQPAAVDAPAGVRSGIERHPQSVMTLSGKIDLDPRMRVRLADRVNVSRIVVLARLEAVDQARRHAAGAEHQDHRRGEIFAMSLSRVEEEVGHRVTVFYAPQVERITVVRAQM